MDQAQNHIYTSFIHSLTHLIYHKPFEILRSIVLPSEIPFQSSEIHPDPRSLAKSFIITPFQGTESPPATRLRLSDPQNPLPDPSYTPYKPTHKTYERLEIGDLVYIKFSFQKKPSAKDPKQQQSKSLMNQQKKTRGIVVSDFNVLVLALKDPQFHEKHAYKCFRKALFEIESERRPGVGVSVAYGDPIRLRHVSSQKLLAVRSKVINRFGGLDLALQDEETTAAVDPSESRRVRDSLFSLMPGDKTKIDGEAAGFGEKTLIKRAKGGGFWTVPLKENEHFAVGVADDGSIFKLRKYLKGSQRPELTSLLGKRLINGDVICLRHKEQGGFLTVNDWPLRKALVETKIKVSGGGAEEKFQSGQLFSLSQVSVQKVLESYQEVEASLEVSPAGYNHFWEVQSINPLQGRVFEYKDAFRLKNVANGLFLGVNRITGRPVLSSSCKETQETTLQFSFEKGHSSQCLAYQGTVRVSCPELSRLLCSKAQKVLFAPKRTGEVGVFSFELQRFPLKMPSLAEIELLAGCFQDLLDFHVGLQGFGMQEAENDQKNPSEFLLKYDYEQALLMEQGLEEQVARFWLSLDCLMRFLDANSPDGLRERQLLVKELKVFELVILLAKLIDGLVYANKNSKEHRQKAILKTGESALSSGFRFSEKSAFFIAKKHLEGPIKSMFKLLGLVVQGNAVTSAQLLEHSEFFTNQLRAHTSEVSLIFRLALHSVKSEVLEVNDQLLDWLASLESLNENLHNIEDQTELIEIISAALIDNQENAVRSNQQRVQMELFSHRGGSEMKKGLLRFGFPGEKPVVILKKDGALKDFLANNPSLASLGVVKVKEKEETAAFMLDELVENPLLQPHVNYISAVLTLIALLTKDRNMKVIAKVHSLEISPQHILYCLKASTYPLPLKAAYWRLYQSLYLDREPFNPLSQYLNRCILWSDIKDFGFMNPTYHLLNLEDLKNPEKEGEKVVNEQFLHMEFILGDFWSERGLPGFTMNPIGDQLVFITVFLQMTRKVIDLGYTSPAFNQKVFKYISKAIEILMQREPDPNLTSSCWLGEVLHSASEGRLVDDELHKALLELCRTLETYYHVLLVVQVHLFMRLFRKNFEDFTVKPNFEDLFTLALPGIQAMKGSPTGKGSAASSRTLGVRLQGSASSSKTLGAKLLESRNTKSNSQIELHPEMNAQEGSIDLDVGIWMLLTENRRLPARVLKNLMGIVERYFTLRRALLRELRLIELIDGKKEEALYKELDGTPDLFGQVISPKKLEFQIEKVLAEFDDRNKGAKDFSQRENKIRELNNVINKLLSKFKETLGVDRGLFALMQNIIRNLQVHEYIFRLLGLQTTKKPQEELELLAITVEFFQLFCLDSEQNQDWVLSRISSFLDLLFQRLSVQRLLVAALSTSSAKPDRVSEYFDLLFAFLRINHPKTAKGTKKPSIPFKFLALEVLRVLRSMIIDQKTGQILPENQKKVLNALLKHDFLLKFAKTGQYLELRNSLLEAQKRGNKPYALSYHLTLLELLGLLARDFKLGVLQLRKLLLFEQLKALLHDPVTPYIFKKPYLRVILEVYFLGLEDEPLASEDFTALLGSLLQDLQASYYFLEYLVKSPKGAQLTEEARKLRVEISGNRTSFLDKPSNFDTNNPEERPKGSKKPASIESLAAETRKILSDGTEYWKYFHGGSREFGGRKDGLVRGISETVVELQRRGLQGLGDMVERLRKSLIKVKAALGKVEKLLPQTSLTKYQLVIHETLAQFPPAKVSGKSSVLPKDLARNPATGDLNSSFAQDTIRNFLDKLTGILDRKKLSIKDFERLYAFGQERNTIGREEFIEKTHEILSKLGPDSEVPKEELTGFVEAFTQFKRGKGELGFGRFLRKLAQSVENKRAIYQREGLKHEKLTALRLEDQELSRQKKQSLGLLVGWFEKDCVWKARDREIQSMIRRFTVRVKDREIKGVGELLRRLIEVFDSYGKPEHLLKVLELFTEELKGGKEAIGLRPALFATGVVQKALGFLKKDQDAGLLEMALRTLLNCLAIDSKKVDLLVSFLIINSILIEKTQEEALGIMQSVENRPLLVEVFGFLKTGLSYQEGRLFHGTTRTANEFKSVLLKTVRMLALFCENCYQPFQNFLREQDLAYNVSGLASANLVTMTAELLGIIPSNPLDFELVEDILKTLIKYCLGPCSNKTLFQFLNDHIYQETFDFLSEDPGHLKKIRVFHISVKLLLSLADANSSLSILIGFLDVEQLTRKMSLIFRDRLRPDLKAVLHGENIALDASFASRIIETGFDIFILLSILKDAAPNHHKLQGFSLENVNTNKPLFQTSESKPKPKSKYKLNQVVPIIVGDKEEVEVVSEDLGGASNISIALTEEEEEGRERAAQRMELEECLGFYKSLVGNVEVMSRNGLRKVFFPKPFLSIYLTKNIHDNLLIEGQNRILKKRLEHLLRNLPRYKKEMLHFRMIGRLKFLDFLVKSWRTLKDLSLGLIFFIVIFLLTGGDSQSLFTINRVVTIIQLVLGVCVFMFCIVERFPMSMGLKYPFADTIEGYMRKKDYFPTRIHKTRVKYMICSRIIEVYKKLEGERWRVLKVLLDYENLYNLLYLAITVIAFINPYYYSLMLLDIIKRSRILQNIIRAVTENWVQLAKLGVFTIIVLYIFAFIVYVRYPHRFLEQKNMYGDSLWHAFLSTMNQGLRAQGGLATSLLNPKLHDEDYWAFWDFSLWFYTIVNLLLVKLVFWIIIDTFRELRERKQRLEREIRTQCFICGIRKQEFELRGNGWQNHICSEHNAFNYLDFALYIEEKDIRDCNELEKYVKEMLVHKNTGFFPMGKAMELGK